MKLIKLQQDHYIIADDSQIKEGDWFLSKEGIIHNNFGWNFGDKKITHSTQPLEYTNEDHLHWNKIKQIYLSEVKELIGEVDVEKKANEYFTETNPYHPEYNEGLHIGYKVGYNQALEDNKEKKYTEEDMKTAFSRYAFVSTNNQPYNEDELLTEFYEFIQSLQPKTEWEIEFVDGKLKLKKL